MPDSTIISRYPTSAALAMTAVKFVVLPDWTYPTINPLVTNVGCAGFCVYAMILDDAESS